MVKFLPMKDLILNENEINALTDINRYLNKLCFEKYCSYDKACQCSVFWGILTELFGKN